jgi:uncharacterized protein YwgA
VDKSDWLLLMIASPPAKDGLDPIRLQKGMFMFARESGVEPAQRYWFVPYNYGPMSPALYRDLNRLERDGLVERLEVPGQSWRRVALTPAGRRAAAAARKRARELAPGDHADLRRIKRSITRMTVSELIRDVYDRYPYFASRTVFGRGRG